MCLGRLVAQGDGVDEADIATGFDSEPIIACRRCLWRFFCFADTNLYSSDIDAYNFSPHANSNAQPDVEADCNARRYSVSLFDLH